MAMLSRYYGTATFCDCTICISATTGTDEVVFKVSPLNLEFFRFGTATGHRFADE